MEIKLYYSIECLKCKAGIGVGENANTERADHIRRLITGFLQQHSRCDLEFRFKPTQEPEAKESERF